MQYSIVMTITKAMAEFTAYDHHIAFGTMMEASLTSSAKTHWSADASNRNENTKVLTTYKCAQ